MVDEGMQKLKKRKKVGEGITREWGRTKGPSWVSHGADYLFNFIAIVYSS